MQPASTITIGEISTEQTWGVVLVLVTLLIGVGSFAFKQLWNQLQEQRDKNEKLEDEQESERHAALLRGIDDVKIETREVKTETRGLRHEVHQLRRDHDELRPRVERIEKAINPEGRD
jgi:uncharacterized protein HemX